MVRGERDYTQRVLATIRPMGILGGRMIFMEDFESLTAHYREGNHFSITHEDHEVFEGDAAGKLTLTAGDNDYVEFDYPTPTADIIATEIVFRPSTSYLSTVGLSHTLWDGEHEHVADVSFTRNLAGTFDLTVYDENTDDKVVKTTSIDLIYNNWHVLYVRFNLTSGKYEFARYDTIGVSIPKQQYYKRDVNYSPSAFVRFTATALATGAVNVFMDNLIVSYEEL